MIIEKHYFIIMLQSKTYKNDVMIESIKQNKENIIKHTIKYTKKDQNIYIKIIILFLHQRKILLLVFLLTSTAKKY